MDYEVVGSFLPSQEFMSAKHGYEDGKLDEKSYKELLHHEIDNIIERQIAAGLKEITDGETRRAYWDKDFFFGFKGIERERVEAGHVYSDVDTMADLTRFTGRVEYNQEHPFFGYFEYLKNRVDGRVACRQSIPSPMELYVAIMRMTDGNPAKVYPSPETLLGDIAEAYRLTILRFYELGCRHIQLDDTVCGKLSKVDFLGRFLQGGLDLNRLQDDLIELTNRSIADLPDDMEVSIYLSSGDTIVPDWDFEPMAENILPKVLDRLNVGRFFMPFSLDNLDQMDVLRFVPAGKRVVLGLLDAHTPLADDQDKIALAVGRAVKYVEKDRLSISPKTGFKLSNYALRGLNDVDQWMKIDALATIARGL